ncbi:MAG: NrsF family protein [Cypionkella sp.]
MNTDELILRLAAQPPALPLRPALIGLTIAMALVGPLLVFLGVLGLRPDLISAWGNPMVPFKTILPLLICGLSITLLLRLSRPEARLGLLPLGYIVPVLAAAVLWVGAYILRTPVERFSEVGMGSVAECMGGVLSLATLPTIVALRSLRKGASSNPTLSAALAGLTAASGAAAGYSLFCTRDNPLFFVTWYGLGILIVTLVAARYGSRMLRW